MVNKVVEEQRDYHISLDEELNRRLLKYLASEFRRGSHVVTAIFKKALGDFLEKKGF